MRTYKCPIDGKIFTSIDELEKYTKDNFLDNVPKKYKGDVARYLYDFRNGAGTCQICGSPTPWDSQAKRYKRLCEPKVVDGKKVNPEGRANTCQEEMRKNYLENIVKVYNTDNLMNDPEFQKKLLENRSIAKKVKFKGQEMTVIGSYEAKFVEVCNSLLSDKKDLIAPCPYVFEWNDGSGIKKHIPDFYIKSLNLIVSIKDGGFHNESHPNVLAKRRNDALKFDSIVKDTRKFNVIELCGLDEIQEFKDTYYKEIKDSKDRYIKKPNNE